MNSKLEGLRLSSKFFTSWRYYLIALLVLLIVLGQTISAWFYQGPKVDEGELVFFGVGFLGGELDPVWNHYGHLGMYLLGIFYFLIGCVLLLTGVFSDFTEYGAHFLGEGYFFILGRIFMATAILLAVLICSKILAKYKVHPLMLIMFVLLMSLSPGAVKYANYVRTDALVALFTICLLYFSVFASTFRELLWAAIFTAAAVACKISVLPISGVLGILIILMLAKKQITFVKAVTTGLVFLLFTQLFSPYMDYISLFKQILLSETGEATNSYRIYYVGIEAKLSRILQFHYNVVGEWTCIIAALGLFLGFFTRYRRLVVFTSLLIFLTVVPYLVGSTLREYWFLSTFMLVGFSAFLAVVIILDLLQSFLPTLGYHAALAISLMLLIAMPLQSMARTHLAYIAHHKNVPLTNKLLAQRWLEKNHLGVSSILIDRNFTNVYPRLFDPAYLRLSRVASGMYGYHRERNKYLSAIFEQYLYKLYLDGQESSLDKSRFMSLKKLRLDFEREVSFVKIPKVCSKYSATCYQANLSGRNNIDVLDDAGEILMLKITGEDPYLVFDIDKPISIDFSFYVAIESDANAWQLFYDFGEGMDPEHASRYYSESHRASILIPSIRPLFNHLGLGDSPHKKIDVDRKVLFVTSESGYGRFYGLRDKPLESLTQGQKAGLRLLTWHDEITKAELVKRFDGPSGSPIDIYDISEYSRDK